MRNKNATFKLKSILKPGYVGIIAIIFILLLSIGVSQTFLLPTTSPHTFQEESNLNTVHMNTASHTVVAKKMPLKAASTNVSGGIFQDTTWTAVGSPYIVTGDVVLFEGNTLTIEPGVVIEFYPNVKLTVRGHLQVNGNKTSKVVFKGYNGTWNGISILTDLGGTAEIHFASIQNASTAIYVSLSNPGYSVVQIYDSSFINNTVALGGYVGSGGSLVQRCLFENNVRGVTQADWNIYDSVFRNNQYGLGGTERVNVYGSLFVNNTVGLEGGRGILRGNRIINNDIGIQSIWEGFTLEFNDISNNRIGIILSSYSNYIAPIHNNNIVNNTQYNIQHTNAVSTNATHNWWGTTNETEIQAKIYDAHDDVNLGIVYYQPFATQPYVIQNDAGLTLDAGDSFTNAAQISPLSENSTIVYYKGILDTLNFNDSIDYYKFHVFLPKAQLTVFFVWWQLPNLTLRLYNPSQMEVISLTNNYTSTTINITDLGFWFIAVDGRSLDNNPSQFVVEYAFNFSLTYLGQNDAGTGTDAGNNSNSATVIYPPGTFSGVLNSLEESDNTDYYTFYVDAGTTLQISFVYYVINQSYGDTWLYLHDPSDAVMTTFYNNSENTLTLSYSGYWYIVVTTSYSAIVSYVFNITIISSGQNSSGQNDAGTGADAGNSFENATIIHPPGTFSGVLNTIGENDYIDYYTFYVEVGTTLQISFAYYAENQSYGNAWFNVYDPFHNYPTDYYNDSDTTAVVNVTQSGYWFISVSMVYFVSINYTLNIGITTGSQGGPGFQQDDAGSGRDAGNWTGDAILIQPYETEFFYSGFLYVGNSIPLDYIDFYMFELQQGDRLKIGIEIYNGSGITVYVDLYNPATSHVMRVEITQKDYYQRLYYYYPDSIDQVISDAGRWYLSFSIIDLGYISYKFSIRTKVENSDTSPTASTSSVIQLSTPFSENFILMFALVAVTIPIVRVRIKKHK